MVHGAGGAGGGGLVNDGSAASPRDIPGTSYEAVDSIQDRVCFACNISFSSLCPSIRTLGL